MNTETLKMRLQRETIQNLENLSILTGINNKAHLIASCIQITEHIVKALVENGGKLFLENESGFRKEIKIKRL